MFEKEIIHMHILPPKKEHKLYNYLKLLRYLTLLIIKLAFLTFVVCS